MLATRIKELRKELGLSQNDLATKLGVSRSLVSAYELGTVVPPIDKIKEMSLMFDVQMSYLTGETDKRRKFVMSVPECDDIREDIEDILRELNSNDDLVYAKKNLPTKYRELLTDYIVQILKMMDSLIKD